MSRLKLELFDNTFTIHYFSPSADIPDKVFGEAFFNIFKTKEELSIVGRDSLILNSEH